MHTSRNGISRWMLLAVALAVACDKGGGTTRPPVDPTECALLGEVCFAADACCSGACSSNVCVAPAGECVELGGACGASAECCTGSCADGACAIPQTCGGLGDPCVASEACCSGRCDGSRCVSADYCRPVAAPCDTARPSDCCTLSCAPSAPGATTGTCAVAACEQTGVACATAADCCSGRCSATDLASGTCQPVPAVTGSSCKTLGEACTSGGDCCSTNCKGGACVQAYSCSAYNDVCYRGEDCCSGLCELGGGVPGRCVDPPGGCVQGGNPCTSASNCCTRLCKDMGTGVKVCAPGGGCRMTGEYCDDTEACCGGSGGFGVFCDAAERAPAWNPEDSSSQDDNRCSNGQSCNPPGNICGDIASQNCCNGKKDVCKADLNGILRCFGGQSAGCPAGHDGANPSCCIPQGQICQFRDQCCGFAPCVPDGAGVLRCSPASACKPNAATCSGTSDTSCCEGLSCVNGGGGFRCTPPPPTGACTPAGGTCGGDGPDCCAGACVEGSCVECAPLGNACSADAQCCSGTCDAGFCRTPCVDLVGGSCTVDADCCSALRCDVPPGETGGTCQARTTTPSCAPTRGACSASTPCCDSAETCVGGSCVPPVLQCSPADHACRVDGDCCDGLGCYDATVDLNGELHLSACVDGVGCACAVPACLEANQPCAPGHECCGGYCANTSDEAICDGSGPCACIIPR